MYGGINPSFTLIIKIFFTLSVIFFTSKFGVGEIVSCINVVTLSSVHELHPVIDLSSSTPIRMYPPYVFENADISFDIVLLSTESDLYSTKKDSSVFLTNSSMSLNLILSQLLSLISIIL